MKQEKVLSPIQKQMFDGDYDDPDDFNDEEQNYISLTPPAAHKLPVEDKYLLVLMKLRTGVSVVDLGEKFNIAESTVNNIFLTWINYLYLALKYGHTEILFYKTHLQSSLRSIQIKLRLLMQLN